MSVRDTLRLAERAALSGIAGMARVRELADDDVILLHPLVELVPFFVAYCPLGDWKPCIQTALPLLRGIRPSRGVRFGGRRFSCAHEAALAHTEELWEWLDRHRTFRPIALHLLNKCIDLFRSGWLQWQHAVERFALAKCVDDESCAGHSLELAESSSYEKPFWRDCNAIYRRLTGPDTFYQRTFTEVVRSSPPEAYLALAKEFGTRNGDPDLEKLRGQVQWEGARAMLLHRVEPPKPAATESASQANEKWLSAAAAARLASAAGLKCDPSWLSRNAKKCGVKVRACKGKGNRKREVELHSLLEHLVRKAAAKRADGADEPGARRRVRGGLRRETLNETCADIERRKEEERRKKERGRSPD
jgi:hypothetical protein